MRKGIIASTWKSPKVIYFVNKESRSESLKLNPFLSLWTKFDDKESRNYGARTRLAKARFNPEIDMLIFDGCKCDDCSGGLNILSNLQECEVRDESLEKVKHVGVVIYASQGYKPPFKPELMKYDVFPNLVDITLYELELRQRGKHAGSCRILSDKETGTYSCVDIFGVRKNILEEHQKFVVEGLKMGMWNRGIPPNVRRAILIGGREDNVLARDVEIARRMKLWTEEMKEKGEKVEEETMKKMRKEIYDEQIEKEGEKYEKKEMGKTEEQKKKEASWMWNSDDDYTPDY